ncbi:MAG: acyltransferase family protein [Anaerolineae bacterium]|nr:acyltransferase family protein [Anaerolineae bacterium]
MTDVATPKAARRYDLDWLRIFAVLLLVPFHSALIFSPYPWDVVYIKDTVYSPVLVELARFIHLWHMPLLFWIAGASTWYALEFRTNRRFLGERSLRLVVPMLFSFAVLIPVMVYIGRVGRADVGPDAAGAFWAFYRGFFTVDLDHLDGLTGAFTPAHVWFVLFLYIFSAVTLPLLRILKGERGQRWAIRFADLFADRWRLFLFGFVLALADALPNLGGKNPFFYITLFLAGYLMVSDLRFERVIARRTTTALIGGVVLVLLSAALRAFVNEAHPYGLGSIAFHLVYTLGRWCWLVAILGLGYRFLNQPSRLLRYASEAAYPFYLLHFIVNTTVAFVVLPWDVAIAVKYVVIVGLTIPLTILVYELLVRRFVVMRFLMGMKQRARVRRRAVEG